MESQDKVIESLTKTIEIMTNELTLVCVKFLSESFSKS